MLKLFLVLTVVANLFVPERVIRYGPCCYDDNGYLNPAHFNPSTNAQERIHGKSCCDPTEYQLRAGVPAPVQVETQITPLNSKSACVIATLQYNSCPVIISALPFQFSTHGPPRALWQPKQSMRINI